MKRYILEHTPTEARHQLAKEKADLLVVVDDNDLTTKEKRHKHRVQQETQPPMKRARVSIMERKQTATRQRPSTKETSMMTPEQAEQLQSWRDERKRRKDQRRVQWRKDDDDDDSVGDAKRAGQNDAASFSDTAKASRDSATASPWSHAPFAIELWW